MIFHSFPNRLSNEPLLKNCADYLANFLLESSDFIIIIIMIR